MATYVLMTRLSPEALRRPRSYLDLERSTKARIAEECPGLTWKASYTLLGEWDYLDVVEAPDNESVLKAASILRIHGNARTEILPAVSWSRYKEMLGSFESADAVQEADVESFPASDAPAWTGTTIG